MAQTQSTQDLARKMHGDFTDDTRSNPADGVHDQFADGDARRKALETEQQFLDFAYQHLDTQTENYTQKLAQTRRVGAAGTPSARSERDSFATHYEDNLARLKNVEHRLVLGRLDFDADDPIHVGRITLRDDQQQIILTDWRAPQSEPFYQATSTHRLGVLRRRHIQTRLRKVTNVEDEFLAAGEAQQTDLNLTGEGALFAAMNKARDGKMGDIVATIQAEQDKIIRDEAKGVLVVQGGPGTGKTAVALHRAAYLLYTYRKQFAHSGVLVIGPSQRFLQYIDQVLPSLGESDVVACTIDELFPGVTPTITESATVNEIKSRPIWAKIVKRAVRKVLQKPLRSPLTFQIAGTKITLLPADIEAAQTRARRFGKSHNEAREKYARQLVDLLANRLAAAREVDLAADDWIVHDIASDPEIRRAINLHWLPASPQWLLEHLLCWPEVLATVAPELNAAERAALQRPKGIGFSAADIPLLDELAENLGPFEDDLQRAARLAQEAKDQQMHSYMAQTMQTMHLGGGIVNSELVQNRMHLDDATTSLAERAISDRTWTYGHVVVDEAQELTPMQWRMISRRNPRRSMTIVGDLDQRRAGAPSGGWEQTLGKLAPNMRIRKLTISYRTPRSILDAATRKMEELGTPVAGVQAVRDIPRSFQESTALPEKIPHMATDLAQQKLAELTAEYGAGYGTLALIAPTADLPEISDALLKDAHLAQQLAAGQISLIDAQTSKGLEFDAVVLINPEQIAAAGTGDLYVAMTRATKSMHVLRSAKKTN